MAWTNSLPAGPLFEPASPALPFTIDVANRKQLLLDDLVIAEVSAISKFQGRPAKYRGNPVLVADRPWEINENAAFPGVQHHGQSVLYDADEKIFKIWYNTAPWDRPEEEIRPWCYAVSRDGYHWNKPNLGLVEYEGSKENNIVAVATAVFWMCVIKTPHDPDPNRCIKVASTRWPGPGPNWRDCKASVSGCDSKCATRHCILFSSRSNSHILATPKSFAMVRVLPHIFQSVKVG